MNRPYELTAEDVGAASHALLGWLESQDINPADAARVLTTCLVAIIHQVSLDHGLCAKDGGRLIANIIVESLP